METTRNPTSEYLHQEEKSESHHKRYADQSPEEVKRSIKEKVKKGIASVAGALEGLNEEVEEDHLSEKTEQAVKNVGETTRRVASVARDETQQTKESLKKAVHAVGESTREAAGAAKEEAQQTREALGGKSEEKKPELEMPVAGLAGSQGHRQTRTGRRP